jgi:hypothetical protein
MKVEAGWRSYWRLLVALLVNNLPRSRRYPEIWF